MKRKEVEDVLGARGRGIMSIRRMRSVRGRGVRAVRRFYQVQIRSADEPMTTFYKVGCAGLMFFAVGGAVLMRWQCTTCAQTWRAN